MFTNLTNICKFYRTKQGCRFKDNCKFRHVGFVQTRSNLAEIVSSESVTRKAGSEVVDTNFIEQLLQRKASHEEPVLNQVQLDLLPPITDFEDTRNIHKNDGILNNSQLIPSIINPSCSKQESVKYKHGKVIKQNKVCHFFAKSGWCGFGRRCHFSHNLRDINKERSVNADQKDVAIVVSGEGSEVNETLSCIQSESLNTVNPDYVRSLNTKSADSVCKYYALGQCRYGHRCRYKHIKQPQAYVEGRKSRNHNIKGASKEISDGGEQFQGDDVTGKLEEEEDVDNTITTCTKSGPITTFVVKSRVQLRSELDEERMREMRLTECAQLKKRLQSQDLVVIEETPLSSQYNFQFSSTDPDWPYDISRFQLHVTIPCNYPLQMFTVTLPSDDSIPQTVRRYIEVSISDWLMMKQRQFVAEDKVELLFRPFLRWLDRGLEEVVTEGLRQYQRELQAEAAGFEFIAAQPSNVEDRQLNEYDERWTAECTADAECDVGNVDDKTFIDGSASRRGTEVKLRELQLLEGVAALLVEKLAVTVQCSRCKNKTDFITPASRLNDVSCARCNATQRLVFNPALCHQFSSVIGYLDVDGCQPFDVILQDCDVTLTCDGCSHDMRSQTLCVGQVKETWCQSCHTKMRLATESVRMTNLVATAIIDNQKGYKVVVAKATKMVRDAMIEVGKPLPENGTCKHYKKSYRWFRFPCCGKSYPCDVCHEEHELDHDMRLANRIICGHCSKEQPYSNDKPCSGCQSSMTKSRSAFWEGGRGCRDKVAMSRNDAHKYKNSSKTVPRRTTQTRTVGKLRHV